VLATILTASIVLMALPFESAEGGRGGDAESEGGMQILDREIETQGQAVLNPMVVVMKVISQKVVMLLVAQQAAMMHH
jgi:hypothetical protein